jgi:hypothetical protein
MVKMRSEPPEAADIADAAKGEPAPKEGGKA